MNLHDIPSQGSVNPRNRPHPDSHWYNPFAANESCDRNGITRIERQCHSRPPLRRRRTKWASRIDHRACRRSCWADVGALGKIGSVGLAIGGLNGTPVEIHTCVVPRLRRGRHAVCPISISFHVSPFQLVFETDFQTLPMCQLIRTGFTFHFRLLNMYNTGRMQWCNIYG